MSFNTPLPNVAWKAFPALFCGNAAVREAVRAHARLRVALRRARARGRASRPASSTSCRGSAPRPGRARRAPGRRSCSFTGSAATGRGSARRGQRGWRRSASSSAARTRSSSATTPTSTRRRLGARVGVLERGPAVRRGEPDRRVRRRLRRVPRALVARRAPRALETLEPGDQRGEPRAHPRCGRRARDGRARRSLCGGARARAAAGWYLAPTVLEGAAPTRRSRCTELFGPVTIALPRPRPRRGARARRTARPTASRLRSTRRASTGRCGSRSRCRRAWSW